jgi:hypothetical protein
MNKPEPLPPWLVRAELPKLAELLKVTAQIIKPVK